MDLLMDFIMELVPDAVTELFTETCFRFIRERVENPVLQKVLCGLVVLVLVTLGVLLAMGILCLTGAIFQ